MTNKEILKADVLDILFEHRNKTYGAYALRREYNHRLGTALGIALSAVLLFIILSAFKKNGDSENNPFKNDSVIISMVDMEKKKPEKFFKEKPREDVKQVKSSDHIQIVSNNGKTDMPDQKDIMDAVVGIENKEGKSLDDPNRIVNTDPLNNGNGNTEIRQSETDFVAKEIPASFPGGDAAWIGFLRKFLQTPDDLEVGERKEVRVRFWIDTDGSLSRFEIVKSGGSEFDKEVLRVMKKMPRWEPAEQNGRKVPVAFTQPVTFVGVEE